MYRILFTLVFSITSTFSFAQSERVIEGFKSEYYQIAHNNLVSNAYPITKWENIETIHYFIEGKLEYTNEKRFGKYLASLTELTGINFQKAQSKEEAQLIMEFGNLEEFFVENDIDLRLLYGGKTNSWYVVKYGDDRIIKSAKLCIDPKRIESYKYGAHSVTRLFLNCLGLPGKIQNTSSIFHNKFVDEGSQMSRRDKQMLRLHYLGSIKAGMIISHLEDTFSTKIDLAELIKTKL